MSKTISSDFLFVRVSCGIEMYKVSCNSEEKPSYIFHCLSFIIFVKCIDKQFLNFAVVNEKRLNNIWLLDRTKYNLYCT